MHFEGSVRQCLLRNPATTLEPVASRLRDADLAMVDRETPVTDRGAPEPKRFVFRASASTSIALRAGGVNVVTIANNHGEDNGPVGLGETLRAGRAARMPVVGAGVDQAAAFAPWRTPIQGQPIAVIGATQVLDDFAITGWAAGPGKPGLASAKQVPVLLDAVRRARTSSDTVVTYLHWGVERQQCPQADATTFARQLVAAGADVVVGSHAHVLVGAGYLGRAYVDDGLGTCLFHAHGGGPATTSGVLTLTTRGHAVIGARWSPAVLHDGTTSPVTGSAAVAAIRARDALPGCTGLAAQPSPPA